ncbi:hypothetical protein BJX63DRAFT_118313 [Aspergillus granulosus]|uniref:Uncharacterized protein n=1 Tax=Aspergillus granulosus TaxID=176169 RepID=A0ABR4HP90_9EURO
MQRTIANQSSRSSPVDVEATIPAVARVVDKAAVALVVVDKAVAVDPVPNPEAPEVLAAPVAPGDTLAGRNFAAGIVVEGSRGHVEGSPAADLGICNKQDPVSLAAKTPPGGPKIALIRDTRRRVEAPVTPSNPSPIVPASTTRPSPSPSRKPSAETERGDSRILRWRRRRARVIVLVSAHDCASEGGRAGVALSSVGVRSHARGRAKSKDRQHDRQKKGTMTKGPAKNASRPLGGR